MLTTILSRREAGIEAFVQPGAGGTSKNCSNEWQDHAVTLLYQADSYAHLGDDVRALDCCGRLPDDFWTPGLDGAPAGGKAEIAEQLRHIAAGARRNGG